MFWSSVINGFGVLLHWQVWAALVVCGLISFLWLMGVGLMMSGESGKLYVAGCLTHLIGGTVLHGLLITLIVFFLLPIMLGGSEPMPISALSYLFWPLVGTSLLAIVLVIILSFVPFVGGLFSSVPGLNDFVQGLIVFRALSATFIERQLAGGGTTPFAYPSFLQSVGYFVIALVVCHLALLGAIAIRTLAQRGGSVSIGGEEPGLVATAAFPVFARVVSLIPVFMYAQFVALTLKQTTS